MLSNAFHPRKSLVGFVLCAIGTALAGAEYPKPESGDYIIRDFHFESGESLPELRIHYRALGTPGRDASGKVTNAVIILHGTTGSGAQFIRPEFAGELFGKGQPLDVERFYLVLPDGIGHGQSSKPSDGLHTWFWGELHPESMDALLPLACLPAEISGRNRVWRRMIIDAIRTDPGWQEGEYKTQPHGLGVAAEVLFFMSSNPLQRYKEAPTLQKADQLLDTYVTNLVKTSDANDVLYALEASRDYNPGLGLEKIQAPLLAINFTDDLINPPELGILEKEIKRVPHGEALVLPMSDRTRGHGTHTLAAVWKEHLERLLKTEGTQ
jgi:homoserine O-acetyltransferase